MIEDLYAQDSLFALSGSEIAGVVLLALVQVTVIVLVMRRIVRGFAWPLRLCGAVLAFWLFEWLSPQAFYTYYRTIIPGLRSQWVIGFPPEAGKIFQLILFETAPSLSSHGRGAFFWFLLLAALRPRRDAAN